MYRKVKGLTLIGFLIVLALLIFFAYMAMRLAPMYIEYYGVAKALEQEGEQLAGTPKALSEIREDMIPKFDAQFVDMDNAPQVTLTREDGARVLRVHYERRKPFMYNIEFVATFDKSVRIADTGDN